MSDALVVLSCALAAYGGAVALHANGFVAAFVAGVLFGGFTGRAFNDATVFTEDVGLFASFGVWVVFGAVFAGPVLRQSLHLDTVLYALASLTIVRMIPVGVSMLGLHLQRRTVAFVGWFGPRGLASVVFTLLAYEDLHHGPEARVLVSVATWTILLSIVGHGLSAGPLARRYGAAMAACPPDAPELRTTSLARIRRRSLHGGFGGSSRGPDGRR